MIKKVLDYFEWIGIELEDGTELDVDADSTMVTLDPDTPYERSVPYHRIRINGPIKIQKSLIETYKFS